MANDKLSPFVRRMVFIREEGRQGVAKHGRGFFKGHAVLAPVCFSFLRVPLELEPHVALLVSLDSAAGGRIRLARQLPRLATGIINMHQWSVNEQGRPAGNRRAALPRHRRRWPAHYDAKQSIGRRYARMDEAGTPYCFTIDGRTKEDAGRRDS